MASPPQLDPEKPRIQSRSSDISNNAPPEDADGIPTLDAASEKKLLRKLDAVFVPIIMLVYLSCFLDRTNIGNVRVAGMPQDIGATDQEFSTAISIFYATYVAFETPWAILLKKLTPRVVLTSTPKSAFFCSHQHSRHHNCLPLLL